MEWIENLNSPLGFKSWLLAAWLILLQTFLRVITPTTVHLAMSGDIVDCHTWGCVFVLVVTRSFQWTKYSLPYQIIWPKVNSAEVQKL